MTAGPDAPVDRVTLRELAAVEDPLGVLSIHVDAAPSRRAAPAPWEIAVRDALGGLRREVREQGPRERWVALEERLAELEEPLGRVLDPRASGRGRALVATLSRPWARTVALQVPLVTGVALGSRARVGSLAAAVDRWRPTGVAAVAGAGVAVHELVLGTAREVARWDVDADAGDWREMKGPAAANPARGQQTAPQRDRFARRLDAHRARALAAAAGELGAVAAARGWDLLIVTGDPRPTGALVDALPAGGPVVHRSELVVAGLGPERVADLLAGELADLAERREWALVDRVGGGRGVAGGDAVRAAIADGRVERLLVAGDADTADDLIGAALRAGAEVTVLHGPAGDSLAGDGGLAAILRW